jgi:hypothetical protein
MHGNPIDSAHPSGKYHFLDDIHPDFLSVGFVGVYLSKVKHQNQ